MDIIADIGGTHSRCALVDDHGQPVAVEIYENRNFDGVEGVLSHYLSRQRMHGGRPRDGAIAIAGPVTGDVVKMTNLEWQLSRRELCAALGLRRLTIVNDFAAVAWSLPRLAPDALRKVGRGEPVPGQALAVLGPGSGLGVAALVPAAGDWAVVSGEGGNVAAATSSPAEATVVDALRDAEGFCAAETLISGPGLANIYSVLAARSGDGGQVLTPAAVSAAAARGEPAAVAAQSMFFGMLGALAGDLALTTAARGGVYIAGGIVPKLLDAFERSGFRDRFESKGRYRDFLSAIPTYVITAPTPALTGLCTILGYR
jgi:glucokinase